MLLRRAQDKYKFKGQERIMPKNGLTKMEMRKQEVYQESAQMEEIQQMLRVIYVSLWGQGQYERVLRRYKQMELKQTYVDSEFNVEGKLLEDILQGIYKLKGQNVGLVRNSVVTNTKQQKLLAKTNITINNNTTTSTLSTIPNHLSYQQYNFTKKQTNNSSQDYYNKQLKLKQSLINKLYSKISKLQDKICQLENELMQYKQQSVNLHRLNESKYSKITELRKQLEQQESLIEQQVTVIEQLENTLNQTILENESATCQDNQQNNNYHQVLQELQMQQQQKNSQQRQDYIQQGRRQLLRQLIQQLQGQISTITLSNVHEQQYNTHEKQKINIINHQYDDDGIQQLQLSFNHLCQTQLNHNHHFNIQHQQYQEQQQQQISEIHHQLQPQQHSQILTNFNTTNYLEHQSIDQPSFLSTSPNRYLQTIETITQQLTLAYNQINHLQSQLSINQSNKYNHPLQANQKHSSTTTTLNPQSIPTNPLQYINNKKKNKSFNFNLSFWK